MAEVVLAHLHKSFSPKNVVVNDLSLTIKDGEFITLLGPSGCGKTTTLRMIAGLEMPTSGDILFDGAPMNDVAPAKRNIAMVFQSYALYPHMTVRKNLEYPLKKRRIPAPERERLVADVAEQMKLVDFLERRPRQLSGGQQQRVALGRAVIRNPRVFLFDEPLSNLDAKLRSYMRAELIQLHQRIGKTMIYVTHDQLEAMTMSDRIAVMDRGELQQIGTPDEIYNAPVNEFVASFIGTPTMNFLRGRIDASSGRPAFRAERLAIDLPDATAGRLGGGQAPATLGLRPEDIALGSGDLPATVSLVEPAGHETIVFLDVSGHPLVARAGAEAQFRPGSAITIALDARKAHLFDGATGKRL